MKNFFEGIEVYRITYGEHDADNYRFEGTAYHTLSEAKADLLKLAVEDYESGEKWWRCTWRRVEKFNDKSIFDIWEDDAWYKVWGDDDLKAVLKIEEEEI